MGATTTSAVLDVLREYPFAWLTMREIIDHIAARGRAVTLNAVASALANLEPARKVAPDRTRRPFRYRGIRGVL